MSTLNRLILAAAEPSPWCWFDVSGTMKNGTDFSGMAYVTAETVRRNVLRVECDYGDEPFVDFPIKSIVRARINGTWWWA